jgi:hypothetical protein
MTAALNSSNGHCRFRGEHPTVTRPASRIPLVTAAGRERAGAVCSSTHRGRRARSEPRLRDSRGRRPASRLAPRRES